jgi:hypothetical protein
MSVKYGALQEDIEEFDLDEAEESRDRSPSREKRASDTSERPQWLEQCRCGKCRGCQQRT